jgi:hypothetical protein
VIDRAIAGGGEEVHPLITAGFKLFVLRYRPVQRSSAADLAPLRRRARRVCDRHCQLAGPLGETSQLRRSHSGTASRPQFLRRDHHRVARAGDLRPRCESSSHQRPIVARPHKVSSRSKMIRHLGMHREKALGVSHRLEASHPALAGGLVRVLPSVVQSPTPVMNHVGHYVLLCSAIAWQLIGHDCTRQVRPLISRTGSSVSNVVHIQLCAIAKTRTGVAILPDPNLHIACGSRAHRPTRVGCRQLAVRTHLCRGRFACVRVRESMNPSAKNGG